jgi:hypothetical protein
MPPTAGLGGRCITTSIAVKELGILAAALPVFFRYKYVSI